MLDEGQSNQEFERVLDQHCLAFIDRRVLSRRNEIMSMIKSGEIANYDGKQGDENAIIHVPLPVPCEAPDDALKDTVQLKSAWD